MTTYIVRRLVQAVFVLFLLSLLFFLLVRLEPGSACPLGLSNTANIGCAELAHLDQPITSQYIWWMGNILRGNFGQSSTGESVISLIAASLPPTVILIGFSIIIQQLIALPLGILSAVRQYSFVDQTFNLFSYVLLSIPAFVLGSALIFLVAVNVGFLAPGHSVSPSLPLIGSNAWYSLLLHNPALVLGDLLQHLVLPAITLIATGIAVDSRFMRATMLQVLHEDYIRTARAKGAPRRAIIFKHAFRNAILPVLTNFGLYLPSMIGGVIVVETVFNWQGVGELFANSLRTYNPDYPAVQILLMLAAVLILVVNLLIDVAYAWLDPRIRYEG